MLGIDSRKGFTDAMGATASAALATANTGNRKSEGPKGERGTQRALGTGAVTHAYPVAGPTRERIERDLSAERLGVGARRLSLAIIGHGGDAVEQREVAVIVI